MDADAYEVERELWLSELALIGISDELRRKAQFVIRTAVRAQEFARSCGTDPIDVLLDARDKVPSQSGQQAINRAVGYLFTDRLLDADRDLKRQKPATAS